MTAGKDHVWTADDAWTEEQQTYFWAKLETNWKADVSKIIQTCLTDPMPLTSGLYRRNG